MNRSNTLWNQSPLVLLLCIGVLTTTAQTSDNPGSTLLCGFVLVNLLIAIGARVYTGQVGEYSQEITTYLPVNEVLARVDQHFPERTVFGRPWQRKRDKVDTDVLVLSTFFFPTWGGCLMILLAGILFGLIIYYLVMGRTEQVRIQVTQAVDGSRISVKAKGRVGVGMAQQFVTQLQASRAN